MSYRITRTPVLPWAAGDVCLRGRTFGLVGTGMSGVVPNTRGGSSQRWTHESIPATTNLKAFAASPYQGADP